MSAITRPILGRNTFNSLIGIVLALAGGLLAANEAKNSLDAFRIGVSDFNFWFNVVAYCTIGLGMLAIGVSLLHTLSRAADRVDWVLANVAPQRRNLRVSALFVPMSSGEDTIHYYAELTRPDHDGRDIPAVYLLQSGPKGGTNIVRKLVDVYFDTTPRGIAIILTDCEYLVGSWIDPHAQVFPETAE